MASMTLQQQMQLQKFMMHYVKTSMAVQQHAVVAINDASLALVDSRDYPQEHVEA